MDKPCRHCEKAIDILRDKAFEQECFGTCDAYVQWADAALKSMN